MELSTFHAWARMWNIPADAVTDYERTLIASIPSPEIALHNHRSEAGVQSEVRLEAAAIPGLMLWRNNVGAAITEEGQHVRYGLANDSKRLNTVIKSADLIGIYRRLITPHMVGLYFGQFVSREIKPANWRYSGNPREVAQLKWAELIASHGGDASFVTNLGSFNRFNY
jgi:hypothetical protein